MTIFWMVTGSLAAVATLATLAPKAWRVLVLLVRMAAAVQLILAEVTPGSPDSLRSIVERDGARLEKNEAKLEALHTYAHEAKHAADGDRAGALRWHEAVDRKLNRQAGRLRRVEELVTTA